ncbi:hypothetical protein HMPREF0977_00754 [Clostridium sp. 1_1_41A1FAA]|nr:hypothetical protein HMPREF0977_00754 [Clostridium sp. 1_1_41A1FAA]SCI46000.1 Uncharacterised protein [uncultured Clostridium sp.]
MKKSLTVIVFIVITIIFVFCFADFIITLKNN